MIDPCRSTSDAILVEGRVTELTDSRVTLKSDRTDTSYPWVSLQVDKRSLILDGVSGQTQILADLTPGERLYAYISPCMTRSIPPITEGLLLLRGVPKDMAPPTWATALEAKRQKDALTVVTDRELVLHLSNHTRLLPGAGWYGQPALVDIKSGAKLLAWYETVTLSLPPQAAPYQVMLFPGSEE